MSRGGNMYKKILAVIPGLIILLCVILGANAHTYSPIKYYAYEGNGQDDGVSGSRSDLTLANSPTYTTGVVGQAINFTSVPRY